MRKVMKAAMVVALVAVSASASAQFSANVGYVSTGKSIDGAGISIMDKGYGLSSNGITVGVGYDMNIQDAWGIAWGLNYTYAFASHDVPGTPKAEYKFTGMSLDIPVRATFTYPVSDALKVFGFAGPKFAFDLTGKYQGYLDGKKVGDDNAKQDLYEKDGNISRFDVKLGLGAGANFNNVLLKVGYDWGLLNKLTGDAAKNDTWRVNQFYVTLGYAF
jgi:opacity protein-like surface antigen